MFMVNRAVTSKDKISANLSEMSWAILNYVLESLEGNLPGPQLKDIESNDKTYKNLIKDFKLENLNTETVKALPEKEQEEISRKMEYIINIDTKGSGYSKLILIYFIVKINMRLKQREVLGKFLSKAISIYEELHKGKDVANHEDIQIAGELYNFSALYGKDREKNLEAIERGLAYFPDHPRILEGKALTLHLLNRSKEALTIYNKLIKDKEDPVLYASRAMVFANMGLLDEAEKDTQTAIRLAPDNRGVRSLNEAMSKKLPKINIDKGRN